MPPTWHHHHHLTTRGTLKMLHEGNVDAPMEDAGKSPTDLLVAQIERIVGATSREATFACGGTIPIRTDQPGVCATQETDGTTLASTSTKRMAMKRPL